MQVALVPFVYQRHSMQELGYQAGTLCGHSMCSRHLPCDVQSFSIIKKQKVKVHVNNRRTIFKMTTGTMVSSYLFILNIRQFI